MSLTLGDAYVEYASSLAAAMKSNGDTTTIMYNIVILLAMRSFRIEEVQIVVDYVNFYFPKLLQLAMTTPPKQRNKKLIEKCFDNDFRGIYRQYTKMHPCRRIFQAAFVVAILVTELHGERSIDFYESKEALLADFEGKIFENIDEVEAEKLLRYANFVKIAYPLFNGQDIRNPVMDLAIRLAEGHSIEYKPGGGATNPTRRRQEIFHQETGIERRKRTEVIKQIVNTESIWTPEDINIIYDCLADEGVPCESHSGVFQLDNGSVAQVSLLATDDHILIPFTVKSAVTEERTSSGENPNLELNTMSTDSSEHFRCSFSNSTLESRSPTKTQTQHLKVDTKYDNSDVERSPQPSVSHSLSGMTVMQIAQESSNHVSFKLPANSILCDTFGANETRPYYGYTVVSKTDSMQSIREVETISESLNLAINSFPNGIIHSLMIDGPNNSLLKSVNRSIFASSYTYKDDASSAQDENAGAPIFRLLSHTVKSDSTVSESEEDALDLLLQKTERECEASEYTIDNILTNMSSSNSTEP